MQCLNIEKSHFNIIDNYISYDKRIKRLFECNRRCVFFTYLDVSIFLGVPRTDCG